MPTCAGCGDPIPLSRGTTPRKWCSDACRVAKARKTPPKPSPPTVSPPPDVASYEPGERGLVDAVRAWLSSLPPSLDAVDAAEAELVVDLAEMVEAGSVPAARELRIALADVRSAADPDARDRVSEAALVQAVTAMVSTAPAMGRAMTDAELADHIAAEADLPDGWRSTRADGPLIEWLGRRSRELMATADEAALRRLDAWITRHAIGLAYVREQGRWHHWNVRDRRDALLDPNGDDDAA